MSKARAASKRKSIPKSSQPFLTEPLRDGAGLIRQPERDPEDQETNDQRELQYLQRLLAARHYQQYERPAVLAKIAQLRALLENEPAPEAKQEVPV